MRAAPNHSLVEADLDLPTRLAVKELRHAVRRLRALQREGLGPKSPEAQATHARHLKRALTVRDEARCALESLLGEDL